MGRRGGERGESEREVRGKGGKGWRKGNRQEGGRDRDVGVSHGKVPPTSCHSAAAVVLDNQRHSVSKEKGQRADGWRTQGFLFCFFHSLALEGGQIRKRGTPRAPASLKDIEAQLTLGV